MSDTPESRSRRWSARGPWAAVAAVLLMPALAAVWPAAAASGASPGWTTSGTQIVAPNGQPFVVTGINWYGFETTSYVAHGLYSHDYSYILDEIKNDGYNTVRIPFSNQMWEQDPIPSNSRVSACPTCKGKHSRDILAMIVNYAGSVGLHVILDDHRSEAGNSAEANGLWYYVSGRSKYTERSWIDDWTSIERWVNGRSQSSADVVTISPIAKDGFPTVLGFDLRNEPHTPSRTAYLAGATWGTGDGISPASDPNPNPFSPACTTSSDCHDWRLAAERAADSVLGAAAAGGWPYPLIFVEGVSEYPVGGGSAASGPYDYNWWGGDLLGVNGDAGNPGAPVVLNAGGSTATLGAPVSGQLVYSGHEYGPDEYQQPWFNGQTCYTHACSPSSLSDRWYREWAYIAAGQVDPVTTSATTYPWGNTGSSAYSAAPVWIGEFGTGNTSSDLDSSGPGSQGQWFTDLVNFVQSSYNPDSSNDPQLPARVTNLDWTYWALNSEDSYALLGSGYSGLADPEKEYSFLCVVERGSPPAGCQSTGPLPPAS